MAHNFRYEAAEYEHEKSSQICFHDFSSIKTLNLIYPWDQLLILVLIKSVTVDISGIMDFKLLFVQVG